MAQVLGGDANNVATHQDVVAPQPQLSQRELEIKIEAAARASAAADARLANYLIDQVSHHVALASEAPGELTLLVRRFQQACACTCRPVHS